MSAIAQAGLTQTSPQAEPMPRRANYNVALAYLRTFVVLNVIGFHAALPYVPGLPMRMASLTSNPRWWKGSPILDDRRWAGFMVYREFNDIYFMALLFFLSGLFVWKSLQRKGAWAFARDRMLRLGVPFLFGVAIAPLAFYPAYATRVSTPGIADFSRQWLSLGEWPTGAMWFIWVLLLFDCAAAALFALAPQFGEHLGRLASDAHRHPMRFFLLLIVTSTVAYVPALLICGPNTWPALGCFHFQASRFFHYGIYFLMGIGVGAYGIDRGLLAADGELTRHWMRWTIVMAAAFALLLAHSMSKPLITGTFTPVAPGVIGGFLFELSCAASCFGFLALFIRFIKRGIPILDRLSKNEYGIYLLHRPFTSWLGYAMLGVSASAMEKFVLVCAAVLALSWGTSAGLRRIPAVARIV